MVLKHSLITFTILSVAIWVMPINSAINGSQRNQQDIHNQQDMNSDEGKMRQACINLLSKLTNFEGNANDLNTEVILHTESREDIEHTVQYGPSIASATSLTDEEFLTHQLNIIKGCSNLPYEMCLAHDKQVSVLRKLAEAYKTSVLSDTSSNAFSIFCTNSVRLTNDQLLYINIFPRFFVDAQNGV